MSIVFLNLTSFMLPKLFAECLLGPREEDHSEFYGQIWFGKYSVANLEIK